MEKVNLMIIHLKYLIADRTIKKKDPYRMDITVLEDPTTKNIEIIFYKYPSQFTIDVTEYPFISKLHIFGLEKRPLRIYQTFRSEGKNNIIDIPQKSITLNVETKALYITDLKLSLQLASAYKLILENRNEN
jgi:hypothetical protein